MKIIPENKRIIVRPSKAQEKTAGGILIPDSAKEKPQKGEVVSVNPASTNYFVGEIVIFSKYGGIEIELNGEELLVIKEDDILAKVIQG